MRGCCSARPTLGAAGGRGARRGRPVHSARGCGGLGPPPGKPPQTLPSGGETEPGGACHGRPARGRALAPRTCHPASPSVTQAPPRVTRWLPRWKGAPTPHQGEQAGSTQTWGPAGTEARQAKPEADQSAGGPPASEVAGETPHGGRAQPPAPVTETLVPGFSLGSPSLSREQAEQGSRCSAPKAQAWGGHVGETCPSSSTSSGAGAGDGACGAGLGNDGARKCRLPVRGQREVPAGSGMTEGGPGGLDQMWPRIWDPLNRQTFTGCLSRASG